MRFLVVSKFSKVVIRSIYGSPACGGIESVLFLRCLNLALSRKCKILCMYYHILRIFFFYRSRMLWWGDDTCISS